MIAQAMRRLAVRDWSTQAGLAVAQARKLKNYSLPGSQEGWLAEAKLLNRKYYQLWVISGHMRCKKRMSALPLRTEWRTATTANPATPTIN